MSSKSKALGLALAALVVSRGFAQSPLSKLKLDSGKEVFEAACISCHGKDGKGAPESMTVFERPATFPDFTDCNGAIREKESDYRAIVYYGGRARGFSEIMPSFAEALTSDQIYKVVGYLRTLCAEPGWPRGELNFPRAFATEKAFPEDEDTLSTAINTSGTPAITSQLAYEKRIGKLTQLEIVVPFSADRVSPGSWIGGIGDIHAGLKRVLAQNLRTGTIFSAQGEIAMPTGNRSRGLGNGVTIFEAFGAFGQALPGNSFVQIQAGMEFPTNTNTLPRAAFWRTALGKTLAPDHGRGRAWSPMMEFLADRDFQTGARTKWDILPQFQVTLSKRQHIRADIGFQIPVNQRTGRSSQLVFYLLWDSFDGGLRDGW